MGPILGCPRIGFHFSFPRTLTLPCVNANEKRHTTAHFFSTCNILGSFFTWKDRNLFLCPPTPRPQNWVVALGILRISLISQIFFEEYISFPGRFVLLFRMELLKHAQSIENSIRPMYPSITWFQLFLVDVLAIY